MSLSDLPGLEPDPIPIPLNNPIPSGNGTAPSVRIQDDGQLVIDWPFPKPTQFTITSVVFEQLIENINVNRRTVAQAKKIFADLGRAAAKMA